MKSRWLSAPVRPCSCPMPILDSSSSTKSTTQPTSRKMACTTTHETWRSCAARSQEFRLCSRQRLPQSSRKWMHVAAATGMCICPSVSGARICHRSNRSTCGARAHRGDVSFHRGWPKPWRYRWRAASRRCCFSTVAAIRPSHCAGHAVSVSTVRIAMPG